MVECLCMKPHFLQSKAWEDFQRTEGFETVRREGGDYAFMAIIKPTSLGNYLFLPYGPTLKNKKALKNAIDEIKKVAIEKDCFFARIEPIMNLSEAELHKVGAQKTRHFDPEHTWVMDLSQSVEEIFQSIGKNKTRAYKNRAEKGISIRKSKKPADIETFLRFYEDIAKRDNFQTNERKYLKDQLELGFTTLYIAEFSDGNRKTPIATTIMYSGDDACYYAYAGADYEYRKKEGGAILLTQMILDAKVDGKKVFDFWGITVSDDPKDPWFGFSKFKKSFGGYQVDYAGTYDIPIKRGKYALYLLLRPINKLRKRLFQR